MSAIKSTNNFSDKLKENETLNVYRQNTLAAKLVRKTNGTELIFTKEFLNNNEFEFLSWNIKKSANNYSFNGASLPSFFAGLLPEGLRLKQIVNSLKTSEDDWFTILSAVGSNAIGDVWVEAKLSNYKNVTKVKLNKRLKSNIDFEELVANSLSKNEHLNKSGIAGVQDKISASGVSLPVSSLYGSYEYILKLSPKDKPSLVENEFNCLQLARAVGLNVNDAKIIKDSNGISALLVRRFDRELKDKDVFKLHQEDMIQIMDLFPADKYRVSMQQIMDKLKDVTPAYLIERLKLIEIYLFNYLIGNGDMHAKNISLYWRSDKSKKMLTPSYDLVSTTVFGDHKMALKMDGKDESFTRKNFITFAKRNGLAEKVIEISIDRIIKKMKTNSKYFDKIAHDDRTFKWLKDSFEKKANKLARE